MYGGGGGGGGHKPLSFGFPAHFGSNCLCNYVANFPQQLRLHQQLKKLQQRHTSFLSIFSSSFSPWDFHFLPVALRVDASLASQRALLCVSLNYGFSDVAPIITTCTGAQSCYLLACCQGNQSNEFEEVMQSLTKDESVLSELQELSKKFTNDFEQVLCC